MQMARLTRFFCVKAGEQLRKGIGNIETHMRGWLSNNEEAETFVFSSVGYIGKLTKDIELWVRITTEFLKELQEPREIAHVSGSPKLITSNLFSSIKFSKNEALFKKA